MKSLFTLVAVFATSSLADAQIIPDLNPNPPLIPVDPLPQIVPNAKASSHLNASNTESNQESHVENEESEWKPQLRIVLELRQSKTEPTKGPTNGITYFSGTVPPPARSPFVNPARKTSPLRTLATLACDEFSLSTETIDGELRYAFSARSRCRLLLSGLQIDAETVELADGVLTVTNAETRTKDDTTMRASEMTIPLDLNAIDTHRFGQPISNLSKTPEVDTSGVFASSAFE